MAKEVSRRHVLGIAALALPVVASYSERERDRLRKLRAEGTRADQVLPEEVYRAPLKPRRRRAAEKHLLKHLKSYHPETFNLPWADYHHRLADNIERAVFDGGWFAMAVPRGGGKTTICKWAVEWAVLHGHKRWPIFIQATDTTAKLALVDILNQLKFNSLIYEDFPEIAVAFREATSHNARTKRDPSTGRECGMVVGAEQLVFPCLEGVKHKHPHGARGSRLSAYGLTSAFRGLSQTTIAGETIRPDFALPDDPQTRESAAQYGQSRTRMQIITGDVAFLNGPNQAMSVVVPCTKIYKDDLADQLLNTDENPEWYGECHKFMASFPSNMALWDEYNSIRRDCMRRKVSVASGDKFYRKNRKEMDEGAVVSWAAHKGTDISAIQHGMNVYYRSSSDFAAEYQNDPQNEDRVEVKRCSPDEIVTKQTLVPQGQLPIWVDKLVAHIDVHKQILFFHVAGASESFEATFVDYGTFPDQPRRYFTLADELRTIADMYPSETNFEKRLYMAVQSLADVIFSQEYRREDGTVFYVSRVTVDCGWQQSTVVKACQESPHKAKLLPMKGQGIGAKKTPFAEMKPKKGERYGHHWRTLPQRGGWMMMQSDVNYWKTQVHAMLLSNPGPGSLRLFRADQPERHRLVALHYNAEYGSVVTAHDKNQTVEEWDQLPNKPDNHFFDNAVGCLTTLAYEGCRYETHEQKPVKRKPRRISREQMAKRYATAGQ